ncbi:RagB/SusD family nutrient uptake outer membrane protein [Mucilaginibacter sabulilitoris]|uniref:RagB/SusD family nutrient uptake outer membrane protein n=1 Tax=Mucilaginibacter sabulilitoris TaxID=1173583 RepID=A0ABZ0TWS8_9SPHI|nr:RagB/SusD family nutrient uptake outer membrane protein [Mucilaginibacter sabulilitoris]WPU96244.1 RagB/SusD family nutrient uptake outer membrane protein [Mucilaginibacter sabulilitoris]
MKKITITLGCCMLLLGAATSCKKSVLDEKAIAQLSSDVNFKTKVGFDNAITGLIFAARDEFNGEDLGRWYDMDLGTDIGTTGQEQTTNFRNYTTFLVPSSAAASSYWNWAYTQMILRANTIIEYAEKPESAGIFANDAEKNSYIAEAKFFRAYTYNTLANLYGGAVIVDRTYQSPKTDFTRSTRQATYDFARADAEFASQWLPVTVTPAREGHIVKGAADHLLTEIYLSLQQYDKAIESASKVIDGGTYHLMTNRFGVNANLPGDVYSDLFIEGNQNRSAGNMESIYVWEFENLVTGGGGSTGRNNTIRGWVPALWNLKDPAGASGMSIVDSLGRGVAYVRPTTYFLYNLWKDNAQNDIRNSKYNIRRTLYYNNPASTYFGKPVEPRTTQEDTMRNVYPYLRKLEGKPWQGDNTSGGTGKDFIVYRLAETYLLRAEAYMKKGDNTKAAADINAVRNRSNAKSISPSDVTMDYILDERARELITEERRRLTLSRVGKLVERTKKYQTRADVVSTIQNFHELYPIPQSAIDANFSAKLEQNPGY